MRGIKSLIHPQVCCKTGSLWIIFLDNFLDISKDFKPPGNNKIYPNRDEFRLD